MIPKQIAFVAVVFSALLLAPVAQGVTVDLSSPQEGTTVYPGETVTISIELVNDTEEMDIVRVDLSLTVEIPEMDPIIRLGSFRLPLEAGEVVSEELEYEIPADLPLPSYVSATIEAVAVGLESGTEDSDTLSLAIAPLPEGKARDGISIDLSSPQEGTTVYPGDIIELTAAVTNDTEVADMIGVDVTLTVEVPGQDPFVHEGSFRLPLEAGETASETFAFEIPSDLPIMEEVAVTIDVFAVAAESGAEASDTLSLTVAPLPEGKARDGISIDLSSPQEGTTVYPGDIIELTAAVTNDTEVADMIGVDVTLTVEVPGQDPFVHEGSFRLPLEAGETASETFAFEIPSNLPIMEEVAVTIDVFAVAAESGAEASDSLSLTVAPLPEKKGKARDGISIDLSSPQEGTTVYPGDTVEFSATLTNDTEMAELIVIEATLTVEIPGEDPFVRAGMLRVPLEAGETVSEELAFDIPVDLPVPGVTTITLEVTAVAQESGAEDSDSLFMTIAPLEP
ncbi:MAG: hypothetical protein KAV82_07735 [Phycisphaerae bacterium]|nr:hypothetical protein [Phycisphaerae bacterium]